MERWKGLWYTFARISWKHWRPGKDYKADIFSFGVVCWNVLTGGIRDAAGDWSTPCCPFSAHNFTKLADNYRLLEKYVPWRNTNEITDRCVIIYIYTYKLYSQSTSKHQMQLKVGKTWLDSTAEVRTPLRRSQTFVRRIDGLPLFFEGCCIARVVVWYEIEISCWRSSFLNFLIRFVRTKDK